MPEFIVPKTVVIPEGDFLMGSHNGRDNEKPVHRVWVDDFRIAIHAVTRREYAFFLQDTGHQEPDFWYEEKFSNPNQPAVGPSWYDAVAYCQWLSQLTGDEYRLPTETEREKASRGGLEGKDYPWGDGRPSDEDYYGLGRQEELKPVATGEPNNYGLYNMDDGVHEWCYDWYDPHYFQYSPECNPRGPDTAMRRVAKGGSWRHEIKISRCAARSSLDPSHRFSDFGFRCAKNC